MCWSTKEILTTNYTQITISVKVLAILSRCKNLLLWKSWRFPYSSGASNQYIKLYTSRKSNNIIYFSQKYKAYCNVWWHKYSRIWFKSYWGVGRSVRSNNKLMIMTSKSHWHLISTQNLKVSDKLVASLIYSTFGAFIVAAAFVHGIRNHNVYTHKRDLKFWWQQKNITILLTKLWSINEY